MPVANKFLLDSSPETGFDPGNGLDIDRRILVGFNDDDDEVYATTVSGGSAGANLTGTTVTHGTIVSPTGTSTTSPFVINITWAASVANAPSGFQTAVINAAQYLESLYTNAVTVNINVGYGDIAGAAMGAGALGESQSYLTNVSYSALLSALQTHNTSATTASVLASLPATAPVSGYLWISTAEAKALGLTSAASTALDGYVGFSKTYGFTYNNAAGVANNTFDFNGTALHELTEVMGRMQFTGGSIGTYTPSYTLLDLLDYTSAGTRYFSTATPRTPGYFSIDGGKTNLGGFNAVSGGDAGDWGSGLGNDALNAFSSPNVINGWSTSDTTVMNALGWTLYGTTPPVSTVTPPTGVAMTPSTVALAALQGTTGLLGSRVIGTVTQIGGKAGDSFSYTLGGTGSTSFSLSSAGSLKTAANLAGSAAGKAYALTVTAVDTTAQVSSAASALDVIVGSGSGDTVSVAALLGTGGAATPSFIYGLGGNDLLNGTGATGKLWFVGGAGADTMMGGSGVNAYLYGSTADSTVSAMDIITNFNAAADFIDLTGIGTHAMAFAGAITGTSLAAYSIGVQQSSTGLTFVYANNTASSQSLTSTSASFMEIELVGAINLGSGNILHS